jgi:hypothetical protein
MSYFTQISYSDTGSLDAFSRLRTSTPESLFATQTQYDTDPLQMETGASGSGVVPTHSINNRMTQLSCAAGTGESFTQSYQYSPYQPGRSQFVALTGLYDTGVAGTTVDSGYFDAFNGVIYRQNGATNLQFILRTSTGGTVSDANFVNQADWNIDPLNGTGPSGINLDVTKVFILIIDLQFLGMGRVRVGFDIDGSVFYAHQFMNANNLTVPYMQTATLPIGMVVKSNGSGATKTSYFKCATVQSEGGSIHNFGFTFGTPENAVTAGANTRTPIMSVRPKTLFNGIPNRTLFILEAINIFVTGNADIRWELVLGGNYTGQTWSDIDTTYSSYEYTSVPGTFTDLTGGLVIASGFMSRQGGSNNGTPIIVPAVESMTYSIALDRAGNIRPQGTVTLLVSGLATGSATRASFSYREIR